MAMVTLLYTVCCKAHFLSLWTEFAGRLESRLSKIDERTALQ